MHFIQTLQLILGFYSILIKGARNGFLQFMNTCCSPLSHLHHCW